MSYQDALDKAVGYADAIKKTVLVIYFPRIDSYGPYGLERFVRDGNDNSYQIAASVNGDGGVTESDWIKAKLQEVAA